jgi:hypothetical protein
VKKGSSGKLDYEDGAEDDLQGKKQFLEASVK